MLEFNRATRRFVFATLSMFLPWGCKHASSGFKQASEVGTPQSDAFHEDFRKLVNSENFKDALKLTCDHYDLQCRNISVSQDQSRQARAVTSPYTNHIVIYPDAFRFLGMPDSRWLASIIEHENFHTRQSMYIRAVVMGPQARILGDRTY